MFTKLLQLPTGISAEREIDFSRGKRGIVEEAKMNSFAEAFFPNIF